MFTRVKHRVGTGRIEGKQGPILCHSERKTSDRKLGVISVEDKTPNDKEIKSNTTTKERPE